MHYMHIRYGSKSFHVWDHTGTRSLNEKPCRHSSIEIGAMLIVFFCDNECESVKHVLWE